LFGFSADATVKDPKETRTRPEGKVEERFGKFRHFGRDRMELYERQCLGHSFFGADAKLQTHHSNPKV
jgi:hypothetical protein